MSRSGNGFLTRLARPLVYGFSALLVRAVVRIFFRRVEVAGADKLPPGPLILAANHPNSILDPLVLAAALPGRRIHFLAAAFFFRIPLVRWLFPMLGVVPVFRREDDPEKRAQNTGMFDAAVGVLERGDAIGIFPEGNTFADPRLQTIRTGAARIALLANEEGVAVHLVPVGLNYRSRHAFRSDVLVMVGESMDPSVYRELWLEDPRAAGSAVTDHLRHGLEDVTKNLARLDEADLIRRLERVIRTEVAPVGPGLEDRFRQSQRILEGIELFRREDPEGAARVETLVEEYAFGIELLGLAESHLRDGEGRYGLFPVLRFLLQVGPPLILGAPVAAWGLLHNGLPYFLVDPVASRRRDTEPQREAVRKIGWGILLFGGFYAVFIASVGVAFGPVWAALYGLSLPLSGLAALAWVARVRHFVRHSRTFVVFVTRRGFRDRMAELRDELVTALTDYSRRFRERRGENPDAKAEPLPEE